MLLGPEEEAQGPRWIYVEDILSKLLLFTLFELQLFGEDLQLQVYPESGSLRLLVIFQYISPDIPILVLVSVPENLLIKIKPKRFKPELVELTRLVFSAKPMVSGSLFRGQLQIIKLLNGNLCHEGLSKYIRK